MKEFEAVTVISSLKVFVIDYAAHTLVMVVYDWNYFYSTALNTLPKYHYWAFNAISHVCQICWRPFCTRKSKQCLTDGSLTLLCSASSYTFALSGHVFLINQSSFVQTATQQEND